MSSFDATSPISIRVYSDERRSAPRKRKHIGWSAFHIAQNMFHNLEILNCWILKMSTHEIDSKGQIGPCDRGILQSTNQRAIESWIINQRSIKGQLTTCNQRCGNRLRVFKRSIYKNISSILCLIQKETRRSISSLET